MKELLQAGVPVPVAIKAAKQSGNVGDDDAQHIINRQHSALTLMSMVLDDVRRGYPKLSAELDRIIQQAIDNAEEFACLYERVNDLEQIRNAMHEPEPEPKPARHKFKIIEGRMVKVEGDDE